MVGHVQGRSVGELVREKESWHLKDLKKRRGKPKIICKESVEKYMKDLDLQVEMVEIELNGEAESMKRTIGPNLLKSFGTKAYALLYRTIILHKAKQSKNFNNHEFLNINGTQANDCSKVIYPWSYKTRNHVLYVYKMREKELQ